MVKPCPCIARCLEHPKDPIHILHHHFPSFFPDVPYHLMAIGGISPWTATAQAAEVPYFSWQRSHAVHHAKTNHMTEGETHVPRWHSWSGAGGLGGSQIDVAGRLEIYEVWVFNLFDDVWCIGKLHRVTDHQSSNISQWLMWIVAADIHFHYLPLGLYIVWW